MAVDKLFIDLDKITDLKTNTKVLEIKRRVDGTWTIKVRITVYADLGDGRVLEADRTVPLGHIIQHGRKKKYSKSKSSSPSSPGSTTSPFTSRVSKPLTSG